jgi:hypothetical protein
MQRPANVPRRASAPEFQRTQQMPGPEIDEDEVPDVGDEKYYIVRTPNSTRRYYDTRGNQVIRQGNRQLVVHYDEAPPQYRRKRFHWLFYFGVGMVLMLVGWWTVNNVGAWATNELNNFNYGMPRTYQTDAVVFKNDTPESPTHVIALNLNGRIKIIVMPQGQSQNARMYDGPQILAANPELVPVTVTFEDVDGSGRKAMIIHVGTQRIVYLNDGNQFQTPKQ